MPDLTYFFDGRLLPTLGVALIAGLMRDFTGFGSGLLTAWLGARLFRAASEGLYRRIALLFLLAAGLTGLLV